MLLRCHTVSGATTNRPTPLDDAPLPTGRFDRRVHVGAPEQAARREYLEARAHAHTRSRPLSDNRP